MRRGKLCLTRQHIISFSPLCHLIALNYYITSQTLACHLPLAELCEVTGLLSGQLAVLLNKLLGPLPVLHSILPTGLRELRHKSVSTYLIMRSSGRACAFSSSALRTFNFLSHGETVRSSATGPGFIWEALGPSYEVLTTCMAFGKFNLSKPISLPQTIISLGCIEVLKELIAI